MMGELKQIHNFRGPLETPGLATFYGTRGASLPYSMTDGTHSGGLEMVSRSHASKLNLCLKYLN
jgi:hypothetical protein